MRPAPNLIELTARGNDSILPDEMKWWHRLIFALSGAVLNFLLASITHYFDIPLYLDSLFTLLITINLGVVAGLMTAVCTNGMLAIAGQVLFPFVLCHILTVLIAYYFTVRHRLNSHVGYLIMGLCIALGNGLLGSFISFLLFEGVTLVHTIDNLVFSILTTGRALASAVFWAGMLTNFMDKIISAIFAIVLQNPFEKLIRRGL